MNELAEVKIDTSNLQRAVQSYAAATGKTMDEVIAKKTKSLAIEIYRKLRDVRTPAAKIRTEIISGFKSGRGLKIRESIRAKYADLRGKSASGLNWYQRVVKSEIGARASAGGFLAYSAHFKTNSGSSASTVFSRYSKMLSALVIKDAVTGAQGVISWPGATTTGAKAVEGLDLPKQSAAIQDAVNAETKDIGSYVEKLLQSRYKTIAA
jgi:hypothetical protein